MASQKRLKEDVMYKIECLTDIRKVHTVHMEECSPFSGGCYPEADGCCGPDCNPTVGYCGPDVCPPHRGDD